MFRQYLSQMNMHITQGMHLNELKEIASLISNIRQLSNNCSSELTLQYLEVFDYMKSSAVECLMGKLCIQKCV
jgi:hypothetical protein